MDLGYAEISQHIYSKPDNAAARKLVLTQGDAVGITESSEGWLKLTSAAGDTPVSGWVRESDLYYLPPTALKKRVTEP